VSVEVVAVFEEFSPVFPFAKFFLFPCCFEIDCLVFNVVFIFEVVCDVEEFFVVFHLLLVEWVLY